MPFSARPRPNPEPWQASPEGRRWCLAPHTQEPQLIHTKDMPSFHNLDHADTTQNFSDRGARSRGRPSKRDDGGWSSGNCQEASAPLEHPYVALPAPLHGSAPQRCPPVLGAPRLISFTSRSVSCTEVAPSASHTQLQLLCRTPEWASSRYASCIFVSRAHYLLETSEVNGEAYVRATTAHKHTRRCPRCRTSSSAARNACVSQMRIGV